MLVECHMAFPCNRIRIFGRGVFNSFSCSLVIVFYTFVLIKLRVTLDFYRLSKGKSMSFPPRATIYNQEIPRNPRSICVPTKRKTEREASIKRINSTRPRDTSSIGGNEREREGESGGSMVEELLFQVEEGDGARGRGGGAYKENGRGRLKRRSHFLFYSFSGRESITEAESHHSQRLVLSSSLSLSLSHSPPLAITRSPSPLRRLSSSSSSSP